VQNLQTFWCCEANRRNRRRHRRRSRRRYRWRHSRRWTWYA